MASAATYETTCPQCHHAFQVAEDEAEGNCPACNTHLRFLEEAPTPPPDAPTLAPFPDGAGRAPTAPASGLLIGCPRCHHAFTVAPASSAADCPSCGASLVLEDRFAAPPPTLETLCPACARPFPVDRGANAAACPHCGAALALHDAFPDDAPAPPLASREESTEADAAPATGTPATARRTPLLRGRFRRFQGAPEPEPTPASQGRPPRAIAPPKSGLPYVVSCPTCTKEFSVGPKEREGNCPHCNGSLAFLTEAEYLALEEAEERKRAFQLKIQAKRAARKQRDEARVARETARREAKAASGRGTGAPEKPAASPRAKPLALRALLGRRAKREAGPDATPGSAFPATGLTPIPTAAERTPTKGLLARFKRAAKTPPAPALETAPPPPTSLATPAAPGASEPGKPRKGRVAAPVKEPTGPAAVLETTPAVAVAPEPTATPTATKGLFGRFRKEKPAPAPAAVLEEAAIDLAGATPVPGPEPSRPAAAAPHAKLLAAATELGLAKEKAPARNEKRAKKTAPPVPTPAPVESSEVSLDVAADVPAAPPVPAPAKKGLLGRFRKEKPPPGPPAVVEDASIDFGAPIEVAAGPAADGKKKR